MSVFFGLELDQAMLCSDALAIISVNQDTVTDVRKRKYCNMLRYPFG